MDRDDDIRTLFHPLKDLSYAPRWEQELHQDIMAALPIPQARRFAGLHLTHLLTGIAIGAIAVVVALAYLAQPSGVQPALEVANLSVHTNGSVLLQWEGTKGEFTITRAAVPNLEAADVVQYVLVEGSEWVDRAGVQSDVLFYRVEPGRTRTFFR